jgi:putative ABC transport system permease protein
MLAKSPVVSTVAALSLALGIAANAAIFAVLNAWLFEPLPYGDPDELVLLREVREGQTIELSPGASIPNVRDYRETSALLDDVAVYGGERANMTGLDVPEQVQVMMVTPNFFEVLRRQPALGRGFRPEEGAAGTGDVVILQDDFWRSRFQGERDVLGRTLELDGTTYTIVGVMPGDFDLIPATAQLFRPTDFADFREQRGVRGFMAYGRMRPGATVGQVQAELDPVSQRIAGEYPDAQRGWVLRVQPARELFPGPTDRRLIMILTAVTLFGLIIACANVANLLLGKAEMRQREVSVRSALGAGRGRILRQFVTESVLLGVTGGVIGTLLSVWVIRGFSSVMPAVLPEVFYPKLDPGVLLATLVISVLAGVLFGLAPALHAVGGNLAEALNEGSRGGSVGRRRKRIRNAFVVGEFAVALALLVGAAFLTEAFAGLTTADQGFNPDGLLTLTLSVSEDRYPEDEDVVRYERELLASLSDVPGVSDVAVMASLPRSFGNPRRRYTVDGRPVPEPNERPEAGFQAVSPGYFGTLEIPLLRGRLFEASDRSDAPPVAVVSEALVAREFPDENPLGRRISLEERSFEIVGVVGDILQDRVSLDGTRGEAIYLPLEQRPLRNPAFALRTAGEPGDLAADVRRAVWDVNPDQPLAQVRSLQAHIDESLAAIRALSGFLTVMAAIALGLAAMGIWGVMAHKVAQQRREIGIRLALGAQSGRVVGALTWSGAVLAGIGMALGLPLAWVMHRSATSMFDLFAGDIGYTYAAAGAGALVLVALLAAYLPARRASRVDPVVALRAE